MSVESDESPADVPRGFEPEVSGAIASMVDETIRAMKAIEPASFLVLPRVLRRVIRQEWDLPTLTQHIPHRKTRIVARNTLIRYVDWDELGLAPDSELPDRAILLARPDDQQLETMSLGTLKLIVWRLLYHARIHAAFDRLVAAGKLTPAAIRQRIHRLGQVEFDEIHTVLQRENFLAPDASPTEVYIEFAALYGELKYFSPHCLGSYFPSFENSERVQELLREDVDLEVLYRATRLADAQDPLTPVNEADADEMDAELDSLTGHAQKSWLFPAEPVAEPVPTGSEEEPLNSADLFPARQNEVIPLVNRAKKSNLRVFSRLIRRADKAFARGNAVGAALQQMQAARWATPELLGEAVSGALTDLQRLVRRLQAALGFDDHNARRWYDSLVSLLVLADDGFWNAEKRLLYDLQKVCVDHEREIYTVDLMGCLLSFGRKAVKRPLPNQREVLMSKHLRSATRRLVSSRLAGSERRQLSLLLHDAAASAERQMRTRLRPLASDSLRQVGLQPDNVPERVAFHKLIEELLDAVAHRGFLTMGDLRDAVSRSNLKMSDLAGPVEFLMGDVLLRADQEFSRVLDGVYQRGDFYLRWLQRLSAVSFGTVAGRFVTRYVAIPYGAALMAVDAIVHIVELVLEKDSPAGLFMHQWRHEGIATLGTFLLFVIHVAPFRRVVLTGLWKLFRSLKRLLFDWPFRFLRLPAVRRFLKSTPVTLIRKFLIWPLIPTVAICEGLPFFYESIPRQSPANWIVVLAAMSVILNSRVGRDVEELTAEWLYHTWTRIRVHIFVALFDLVMESFKRLLEWFDRVLYAVDEWLRFKSGETVVSLALKAVLGVAWYAFTFVLRFCVNLLIEPQINPIKHFPVVTVAHKLLLPLAFTTNSTVASPLAGLLMKISPLTVTSANAVAATVVWGIPGIFGFLVWELKSNWRLYRANRSAHLSPVLVGSHGETFIRLMKPGFHSGTLPKLFAKLRRVDRRRDPGEHSLARSRYLDQLHHVHVAVEHFVERELLQLLSESGEWPDGAVQLARIRLASNNIRIDLTCPSVAPEPLQLVFEEQSGWLLASTADPGWVRALPERRRQVLMSALTGFYRLSGVDLVREQIAAAFAPRALPYDVTEVGLIVWPDQRFLDEATYELRREHQIRPWPRHVARAWSLPALDSASLIFAESDLSWDAWESHWDQSKTTQAPLIPESAQWRWAD